MCLGLTHRGSKIIWRAAVCWQNAEPQPSAGQTDDFDSFLLSPRHSQKATGEIGPSPTEAPLNRSAFFSPYRHTFFHEEEAQRVTLAEVTC